MAGLGLWYALAHGRRLTGAVIAAAGVVVALIAIELVIPHFNRAGTSSFFTRYSQVGSTPGGIVHTAVTNPWQIVTTAFTGRGLGYLARLVLPLGGLVVLAPLMLLAALPELAVNLLSAATTQTSIRFHYTAGLIPVLLAAAVFGAKRARPARPEAVASIVLVLGVASNYLLGPVPIWRYFPGGEQQQAHAAEVSEHDRIAAQRAEADPRPCGRQRDQLARRAPLRAAAHPQLSVHPGRAVGRGRRDGARLRRPARALADGRPALLAAAQPGVAARLRARRDPDLPARELGRKHEVERDHRQVAGEQEPDRPPEREERRVMEEPDLREHDRDCRQGDRDPAASRDHERQQPDEVLRREDLREGQEAGDGSSEGERQPGAELAEARVQEPDGGDRDGLEREQRRGDRVGRPAGRLRPATPVVSTTCAW